MSQGRATVDGLALEIRAGETILEGAERLNIEIPTLCKGAELSPEGGCRLCLVEVENSNRPQAACHTPLQDGMVVNTASPRIEALRKDILDLMLSAHPEGVFQPREDGNEMEAWMARYGLESSSYDPHGLRSEPDESHPYLRVDPEFCILCRRCLHACEEIQGQFVYGIEGRGGESRLIYGPTQVFAESPCVACGACVDACPTGAITDRDRHSGERATRTTQTVCGYCGVGCQLLVESHGERVLRIRGVPDAAVNRGHLCGKGRYAHAYHHASDRLTQPLLMKNGGHEPVDWDEAISWLAGRLQEIQGEHGPDALGAFTSSRSTNEAAYLLQKLFRTRIGTNNVDCCARVCHSSTALALQKVTGTGAASASYVDIERARCIVLAGANATEAHPVLGARIKQAVLRGTPLVVIDPRRIELAQYAEIHLQLRAGTNVALFNALAKVLIEEDRIDRAFLEERVEGWSELRSFLRGFSLEEAAGTCEVPVEEIVAAARLLGEIGPTLFVHGLGLSELTQGTASVMTLCNLGMLTGSIGRPGAGMLPLRGQNNVQGNADMGAMPNLVTGYQKLDADEVGERLLQNWGALAPEPPGKTIPEMIDAAARGEIRALWIQGEDVAQSDPNQTHVLEALGRLDLLVVQEMFFSETARYAHLILPAAGALEQEGTFTNGERRIQHVRPAVASPGEARPDWEVIRDVGIAMGASWSYANPAQIMDEIARVAPALFGGVSYTRLESDGLQWPCPDASHPGTATVHAEGFLRGKGQLACIDFIPSPEHNVSGFAYLLITGRVLDHYNVGTMTRRTPNRELTPEDALEIHPDDAARQGIADGTRVGIESRWGRTTVRARLSRRVARGSLFLSFHFPETHTNLLTGPQVDPDSRCPEYKVTAVRLCEAEA